MKRVKFVKTLLLIVGVTFTLALGGCAGEKEESQSSQEGNVSQDAGEPTTGGSIIVGIPQDIEDSLDPHAAVAAGTEEILFNIFEGLLKYDEKGNLIDAVASAHTASDDGKTYTFTLRDGVKFHDGSTVTLDDVIYSIERSADVGVSTSAFLNIAEINELDDKTIEIILTESDTEFLCYMTTAIIPASNEDPATNAIGTGPYKYVSRSPQENIVIEKFDEYWGEPAYLDEVTFKIISDANAIVTNLKSGAIDMYSRLTTVQAQEASQVCDIYEGTMNLVQALYLNNAAEPLDDVRVRQALAYAINEQEILDLTSDGKGTIIGTSMIPAFEKYHLPELADAYPQDVEKAKELLAEAGYPDGIDLTITVPSNYQPHIDTAQVLVEQLKQAGVNAEIQLIEWDSWLSDVYTNREYQATVVGVDASVLTPKALLERFNGEAGNNFINYSNEEYDALYKKATSTTNEEEVTESYIKMEKLLSEDCANVYIQDMANLVALNKEYGGYEFYPIYVLDMSKIYLKQ